MSVTRASHGAVRASHRAAESAAGLVLLGMALALHRDGLLGGPAFYERDTQLFYAPLAAWVGHQLQIGTYPL